MTQPHVNIIYLITMASNAYKIFQKFVSEINEQILRLRRYGSNLIKTKENSYRRGFHAPTLPLHISENCDTKWVTQAINKLLFMLKLYLYTSQDNIFS